MITYFCGNLSNGKIVPSFTEVLPTNPELQLVNMISIHKNIIGIDKTQVAYEWHVPLDTSKTPTDTPNNEISFVSAFFLPAKSLNEHFYNKKITIIDIKTTKSELYVIDDKCTLSAFKIKDYDKYQYGMSFKLITENLLPQEKIIKVCCGNAHCVALSNKGLVYSWGSSLNGRLGQGKTEDKHNPELMCHLLMYNVIDISCGLAHNFALGYEKSSAFGIQDNTLKIMTWGYGANGALGLGSKDDVYIPTANDFFNSYAVKSVYCGYYHSLAITVDGEVFGFGSNEYGQVGCSELPEVLSPQKVFSEPRYDYPDQDHSITSKIVKLIVGPCHNMAFSEEGSIYTWGLGSYGQLGNGSLSLKQFTPTSINGNIEDDSFYDTAGKTGGDEYITNTDNLLNYGAGLQEIGQRETTPTYNRQEQISKMKNLSVLPRHRVKKYLPNIVVNLWFDCSFVLVNKKFKYGESFDSIQTLEQMQENRNSVKLFDERKSQIINDPMGKGDLNSSISMTMKDTSFLRDDRLSVSSKRDEDILSNILTFVSTHIPSLKMDNFTNKERESYSKEDEELHKKVIENVRKDYLIKAKEMEVKEKMEKKNMEKKEKQRVRLKDIWVKDILPYWHSKKGTSELRELWKKGIPPSLRDQIWTLAIGNRLSITKQYYEINLKKAKALRQVLQGKSESQIQKLFLEQYGSNLTKESSLKIIDIDLPRTFPSLAIFSNRNSPIYESLQNVLDAFVISRPDIGYVQGMSFIAGLFLLYMQPYDAFRCFANVICRMSLIPFFLINEQQINNRMSLFKVILEANYPKICNQLEKERVPPQSYLFKWLLTLFTNVINLDAASRIWDLFFLDGDIILYKAAVAVLKLKWEDLQGKDLEGILKVLSHLSEFVIEEDILAEEIYKVEVPEWVLEEFEKFNYEFTP